MDVREKLVEVERAAEWFEKRAENTPMPMARKMFELAGEALREKANGVTVQEWISVKDQEEPTENGTYLCHGYWFGSRREQTETAEFFGEWNIANNFILTHWMPLPKLPQPPKGE